MCRDCLEIYGGRVEDWHPWVRDRVNQTRRWTYEQERASENDVPLGDFEIDDEGDIDEDLDEPLYTRDRDDMVVVYEPPMRIALPYAPYDNEEQNQAYRKSVGIPQDARTGVSLLGLDELEQMERETYGSSQRRTSHRWQYSSEQREIDEASEVRAELRRKHKASVSFG